MSPTSGRAFAGRFGVAFVLVLVITIVAVAGAYWEAAKKISKVPKVKMDTSVLEPGGNYLLIGSDSRAFVDTPQDAQQFGNAKNQTGQRSDTIMVAHVDGGKGTGVLVSFPRDLWVDIPGMGHAKINAAFNAGPQRLIQTIEQNFNVPISHYLQVDFAGFRNLVNAIGTIPIYFPTPARDVKSGLYIDQAGCKQMNGDDALAYVRSRYYEMEQNGKWSYDPLSDLGRIKRQQYFLRTLSQQALHRAQATPWRATKIVDAMLASIQRDPKLGFSAFKSLAYAFHGGNGQIDTATLPTHPQTIEGQAALLLDDAKAAPLLATLRGQGRPTAPAVPNGVAPSSVRLAVRNGSGRAGLAATALAAYRRFGFVGVPPASNADRSDYPTTEIRYASGAEQKARLVLAYLGGAGKIVAASGGTGGADVVLVIGRDFDAVSAPASSPSTVAPSAASASAPPESSSAASTPASAGALPVAGC